MNPYYMGNMAARSFLLNMSDKHFSVVILEQETLCITNSLFSVSQDEFPLASLPLIGYSVGRPVEVK